MEQFQVVYHWFHPPIWSVFHSHFHFNILYHQHCTFWCSCPMSALHPVYMCWPLVYLFATSRYHSHHMPGLTLMNGCVFATCPPSPCLCLCDVGLTCGSGSRVGTLRQMKGQKCVLRSFSSGSPSPPCARPTPAFHSNLMIMIFAQDDLCLHSVITPPAFYDLSYWKSMGHKRAPSELIIITARFSLQHDQI